jgi:hypothetical protein
LTSSLVSAAADGKAIGCFIWNQNTNVFSLWGLSFPEHDSLIGRENVQEEQSRGQTFQLSSMGFSDQAIKVTPNTGASNYWFSDARGATLTEMTKSLTL